MTALQAKLSTAADLRLAAIDLDGTLLSPDLTISAANRQAIAKLEAAGIEVVIASGRHHASIQPFADQLKGVRWIISAQGGEVSNAARTQTLSQTFLKPGQVAAIVALKNQFAVTAIFYVPEGILTDARPSEAVEFYTRLSGLVPAHVSLDELGQSSIYKVSWIALPAVIDRLAEDARVDTLNVQKVRTLLRAYEFMPTDVSKASGLAVLTKHLGLTAQNVVVFGDADNDIPMFEWAGLSFAMDHGWPSAKARADQIAPLGAPESALARAVDLLTAERHR